MSYETIRLVSSALGLPKEYFITAPQPDVVQCFLNAHWIRSIAREGTFFHPSEHEFLTPAEIHSALYLQENVGQQWQKVLIQVLPKEKDPAYALARSSGHSLGLVTDVSYSQHLHYVATSNSKNLWKDAYKKYSEHAVPLQLRESGPIGTEDQAAVLREAVHRMFGCTVIPYRGKKHSTWGLSYVGSKHPNIVSSYFALENETHFFVLLENIPHTVRHCVSFSPAILGGNEARPLFILYQLIEAVRDIHDRGLHLGDITLDHLLLDANLHLTLLPVLKQSVLLGDSVIHYPECSEDESIGIGHNHIKDPHCREENANAVDYMERFHSFASLIKSQDALSLLAKSNIPCSTNCQGECNFRTSLPSLVQLWAQHQITNLDYLLCLNYLANRTFGSPQHHPIVPWVTDFSSPTGGWRDLTKTKFRLNKGDQQLEQTYQIACSQEGGNQVAHHVTEVFSEITYYVYKARVTSKPLLTRYVRQQWVPEQYPSTMSRLYQWTPDECIPEFYTDTSIFRSLHGDLCDLEVPNWCSSADDFLQWHLGALESAYVSQKLHHWIDLNFGHKLSGAAAVKAKNVCLQLVDGHTTLSSGGVVQVFTIPHPPRQTPSPYLGRSPPKITYQGFQSSKPEKIDDSVEVECSSDFQEEDRESVSSLSMSHKLSRSRTSLAEEKPQQVPSISLPQDYNPLLALNQLEMLFNFVLKISKEIPQQFSKNKESQLAVKQAAHLRRVRDMQALGCIMVEIFAPAKCRILGPLATLEQRYKLVKNVLTNDINDIPRCVRHTLSIIFQTNKLQSTTESDLPTRYDPVTSGGLPPPSPHQFLQRLINVIVFPKYFQNLYAFVSRNREYSKLFQESQLVESETEKKKFMQKVVEIQVHLAAKALPQLLPSLTTEGMEILLPYLSELFKNRETCVTAAWYLTGPLAQALGPAKTKQYLLPSLVRLYEADVVTSKHLKLFHRSFLLQLIVRLELQTFLTNFITPLIEGVGGYKEVLDTSQTATEIVRKQSTTLKSVEISLSEGITSPCEEDSHSSTVELTLQQDLLPEIRGEAAGEATDVEAEPEVFVFDEGGDGEGGEGEGGDGEGSPDTLHDPQQLRSPVVSDTVSLDETSLQDTQGSVSPVCPSPHSPTPSVDGPASDPDTPTATTPGITSCINIPKLSSVNLKTPLYSTSLPNFGHDKDFETEMSLANNLEINHGEADGRGWYKEKNKVASMSEICCESVLWLSHRLGPVLTSRYLTRNLLRMLTLCYLPEAGALTPIPPDPDDELSVSRKRIAGDRAAAKVLQCLSEIACLYGEQVILVQYLCHVCELVASCRRRLSGSLEGGLLGAMALLQHLLTYLTDATFMEHLQEMLIRNAVYPVIRLLSSTKVTFPHGGAARGILAYRIVDCIFIMALRVGREMSKTILTPTITRFLTAFDKVHTSSTGNQLGASPRSFETDEGHVEDCESPACTFTPAEENQCSGADSVKAKALEEMKQVFCPELAYVSYVPLCRFLGASYMESSLPNHDLLRSLCLHYDENNQAHHAAVLTDDGLAGSSSVPEEGSPRRLTATGTNVALTGNRIDIKDISEGSSSETDQSAPSIGFALAVDITKYTNKMTNPLRHLRGNWLAYWEHEIGRSEQDCRFNFKQIKLQTFSGHTSSVKSLHVLDNENSFISCSKDKTVKLWSLRSQGDGSVHSNAQWTYTGHKKSVFSVSFCDSIRLAASCDSTVHIWDPFLGASVKQLDSLKYSPVTVLTALAAPSSQLLASTTDATLKVLDLRTCSYTHEFKVSVGGAGLVRCVSTDDEGRLVAVAHSTGIISVLDIRTGHLLSTWKPHEGEVLSVQWHKGGTFLSSALDQTVSVWSVDDSKLKFTLRGPTEPVHLISLYGDEVITGTTANRIGVHTTISPTASFSSTRLRSDTFRGVLTTMALLPLNRLLLLGADNGTIRLLC